MRTLLAVASVSFFLAGCNCGGIPLGGDAGPQGGGSGGNAGGGTGGAGGGASMDGGGGTGGSGGGGGSAGGSGGGAGGGAGGGSVVMPDGGCAPQVCYPFASGTPGTGACKSGLAYCVNGTLGPCVGAIGPSTESCNSVDDDCNGTVDDPAALGTTSCGSGPCKVTVAACTNGAPTQCTPSAPAAELCDGVDNNCNGAVDEVGCSCIYVSPTGNDTNAGSANAPLRTLTAAIALSASDAGLPKIVCAAAGATCPANFDYAEAVTMKNGVSVYGGYQQQPITDGGTWPRCATAVTRITAQTAKGVLFDSTVTAPTVLDGFDVRAANLPANAAVTVEGSTGAIVNDNVITAAGGNVSIGIDVLAAGTTPATPLLTRNTVIGGTGATQAIGIHALGSAPIVQLSCGALDNQGRCPMGACQNNPPGDFIRGRAAGNNGGESYGVWLEGSPGAIVQESSICSSQATGNAAGVRITGNAAGTIVRTSTVDSDNGAINSVALLAEPCRGASPWVFNNFRLSGRSIVSMSRADGVRAVGHCDVRVDNNRLIVGGEESANNDAIGVYCARDADAGISSQCTVLNNTDILGSGSGIPPRSVGVQCDDGACARIENNRISGRQGQFAAGVVLNNTGAVVARNNILAGCAGTGVGLVSRNSFARVENNVIRGTQCTGLVVGPTPVNSFAVQAFLATGPNELDLHSNTIFAEGARLATCTSRGIAFDVLSMGVPSGPRGIVRNNIIQSGVCGTTMGVHEFNVIADPRVFENNDLFSLDAGTLYKNENAIDLNTAAGVNGLMDMTVAATLSADPQFDGGVHLGSGSVCRNAGTATAVPLVDFENDVRPQESAPDIGADEYKP